MTRDASPTPKYFDLHTTGIGYLNRIREVPVRRGSAFLACDIAALHGAEDAVEYTRFDCKVAGGEAEHLVRRCQAAVSAGKKVLLAFRIGDLWVDPFLYEKGDKVGQPGASVKGRLLFIAWIRIDGQPVYRAEPTVAAATADEAPTVTSAPDTPPVADATPADSEPPAMPRRTRARRKPPAAAS